MERPLHESYSDEKGFTYKLDTSELELSVQMEGFAEIRQWFAAESSRTPRLVPFWPGTDSDPTANKRREGYLLECIHLPAAAPEREPSGTVFRATVTLHPTREYVAVIGTNYWEGALSGSRHPKRASLPFLDYSITYGDHLHESASINRSSPLTMLDCQRGVAEVWMRVAGKGWRRQLVRAERTKKPAPAWPVPRQFVEWIGDVVSGKCPASDYLGARDIYQYLSDVGAARPRTVADFSIFSHAWAGGPILFNTLSGPASTRLESDLDMRAIDFLPENNSSWSKLPEAFVPGGNIHVWGCYATILYNQMATYLNRTKPDTKDAFQWKDGSIAIALARPEVVRILNEAIDPHSYMKQAARYARCPVYGGPPGYGSEWVHYTDLPMIPEALRRSIQGKIMHIPATSRPAAKVRRLYEGPELGSRRFDEFGYMLYTP
jgi:hypothetical protein